MLGFAYASVPLYRVFCKVTGFGGTVRKAQFQSLKTLGTRDLNIRFNSDVELSLPWNFLPLQISMKIKTGENALAFYSVENLADMPFEGIAIYNVTPHKAAKYFNKVACFCFERQVIAAKQKVIMPVSFFIDKKFDNDKEMNDINTITLSYMFFKYEK